VQRVCRSIGVVHRNRLSRSTLADFALNRAFFSLALSYRKPTESHYRPPRDCTYLVLIVLKLSVGQFVRKVCWNNGVQIMEEEILGP
jgi:hypothetical protein